MSTANDKLNLRKMSNKDYQIYRKRGIHCKRQTEKKEYVSSTGDQLNRKKKRKAKMKISNEAITSVKHEWHTEPKEKEESCLCDLLKTGKKRYQIQLTT